MPVLIRGADFTESKPGRQVLYSSVCRSFSAIFSLPLQYEPERSPGSRYLAAECSQQRQRILKLSRTGRRSSDRRHSRYFL
jgi:hypothetical protein